MKKILLITILGVSLALAGCGQQTPTQNQDSNQPTANVNQNINPNQPAPTAEKGIVACSDDQACLRTNFLACQAATFKMPFMQGSEYAITVIGQENGNCHYKINVTGQAASDCLVPMNLINDDRFGHFFGQEKVPGREKIASAQQKMDSDYCQTK
ncbi:MAG: hypothetical protein WC508_06170 [Patescibacteria group bacterium]